MPTYRKVVAFVLALATAGCGKKSSKEDASPAPTPPDKTVAREDFAAICRGEKPPGAGAPFAKGSGKVVPALFFHKEGKGDYVQSAFDTVASWKDTGWQ